MIDETVQHWLSLDPDFQPAAAHLINALRAAGLPAVIISGRRSASRNREVGGAPRSLHLHGEAMDVAFIGWTNEDVPP